MAGGVEMTVGPSGVTTMAPERSQSTTTVCAAHLCVCVYLCACGVCMCVCMYACMCVRECVCS